MASQHQLLPLLLLLAVLLFASPLPRPATADDGVAAQSPPLVQQFYYYSPPPPSSPLPGGGGSPPTPPSVPCNCEKTPPSVPCNCEKTPGAPSPPGTYNYSAPGGHYGFLSGSHVQAGGRLHPRQLCAVAAALLLVWWC